MRKFLLALTATVAFLGAAVRGNDDMKEMMQMLHSTCQEKTGVAEELIVKARTGDFTDDKTLKCYMKCIFVETSAMGEDGALDTDALISMLPPEISADGTKVINACKSPTGADACEKAFSMHKCMYKESPKLYFLI